jgi:amidohydrolase
MRFHSQGGGSVDANESRAATKARAHEAIDRAGDALISLSRRIHAQPELCFKEYKAAGWAGSFLESRDFAVHRGIGGLETAFEATFGDGPLVLAFCAEYDALPEIGHACGHNLICASSLGAALGLASIAEDIGVTVKVIGTPAEEGGGGKVKLLDAGAYDGIHAALMAHPMPGEADLIDMGPVLLALAHLEIEYTGRAAHAAGMPQAGINALDAVTIAQTAIGLLRQQLPVGDLVHGIVRYGGDAANVIPARTVLDYNLRSVTLERVRELQERVGRCFEAGALATGCTVDITSVAPSYAHLEADLDLTSLYGANSRDLGRTVFHMPGRSSGGAASTDMGNVSLRLPAIHPGFGIPGAHGVPHHPDFAASCVTPEADASLMHAATALAWTAIDAALDEDVRARLLRSERRIGVPA